MDRSVNGKGAQGPRLGSPIRLRSESSAYRARERGDYDQEPTSTLPLRTIDGTIDENKIDPQLLKVQHEGQQRKQYTSIAQTLNVNPSNLLKQRIDQLMADITAGKLKIQPTDSFMREAETLRAERSVLNASAGPRMKPVTDRNALSKQVSEEDEDWEVVDMGKFDGRVVIREPEDDKARVRRDIEKIVDGVSPYVVAEARGLRIDSLTRKIARFAASLDVEKK